MGKASNGGASCWNRCVAGDQPKMKYCVCDLGNAFSDVKTSIADSADHLDIGNHRGALEITVAHPKTVWTSYLRRGRCQMNQKRPPLQEKTS
jgi:hypothetical protein